MASFEENLSKSMFSQHSERSFIDKMLARRDIDDVREIIKKKDLTREDLLEILYMLSSSEAKLLNYSEWDRYIILKYFVWLRDFIKVAEIIYQYEDDLKVKQKSGVKITDQTVKILNKNKQFIGHNAKFLIDLYFNIARTTLSLGATGIMELLKQRYEVAYPTMQDIQTPQHERKPLLIGRTKGG